MKSHILRSKIVFAAVIGFCILFTRNAYGGEFVISNQTYTYSASANGFSYQIHPGASMPSNWLSPDNYWNGTVHAYYRVIDVPSNEPFSLQMCYFQFFPSKADWDGDYHNYYETCSYGKPELQGEGDELYFNYGSPANFWQHPNGAVDFARVYDFDCVGPIVRSNIPGATGVICPAWGGGSDAAWAERAKFFPLTLEIIIVAVSSGSTFSGWGNYTGGCTPVKKPTPTYGIDYTNHTTDKVVPSTDEYSYNSNMSGAVNGTGAKLALTAGQDVYFRTKASGDCSLASDIQHLDVPDTWTCTPVKQATPTYGIDYTNHTTNKVVPSTDEYSYSLNMSGAVSGTGVKLALTAGQDVYFRTKASGDCLLVSDIQTLDVPPSWGCVPVKQATPTYAIDYFTESTNKIVPSTDEYSIYSNMTDAVSGTGSKVTLLPGQTLYFRTKRLDDCNLASDVQSLYMPARPAKPSAYTVDFINEKTVQNVPATVEYAASSSFAGAATGTGVPVSVTPGGDLYSRVKATTTSLCSEANHLVIPARPAAPSAITIDFNIEKTGQAISSDMEYSTSSSMASPVAGTNATIPVTPGTDLYIRYKSTASQFSSAVQTLDVPVRPAAPSFAINYVNEETDAPVTSEVEYAYSPDMTGSTAGVGSYLQLTPGTDVYFRKPATSGSFRSPVQSLAVPSRPAAPSFAIDYINEQTTAAVDSTIEFSASSDFAGANTGTGIPVVVNPGQSLYIRIKATANAFVSPAFLLDVPARPATPSFTIDFVNEETSESVGSGIEYSAHEDFTSPLSGPDSAVLLEPGNNLYFRVKSTSSSFCSQDFLLEVPQRPYLDYKGEDTITIDLFTVQAILNESMTGFDLSDLSVTNGMAQNLHDDNIFDVVPAAKGIVEVSTPANSFENGGFASNTVTVYFDNTPSAIPQLDDNNFIIYPMPATNGIIYIQSSQDHPYAVDIYSVDGRFIKTYEKREEAFREIDLQDFSESIYFLKITTNDKVSMHKIILK